MNPSSFYKLSIISVISLIIAAGVWILAPEQTTEKFFGTLLFPDLMNRLNEIEAVSIEHENKTLTFTRDSDGGWTLMENGYPANKNRIRNTLIELSRLEKIEPKTALPEFYPDLQVEDISAKGAKSYLLTLLNAEGQPLTSLLIGKRTSGVAWNGQGYFIRFPNERQSWLVRGNIDITGSARTWLSTKILPLTAERISSVTIVDRTKKREIVYKRLSASSPLSVSFMSDAYFKTSSDFIEMMEKALTAFSFEDVSERPADLAQQTPSFSFMIETNDGLDIYMFIYSVDTGVYAAVSFSAEGNAPENVQKEAGKLENIHRKWLYKMPLNKVDALLPFLPVLEEKTVLSVKKSAEANKSSKPASPKPQTKKSAPSKK